MVSGVLIVLIQSAKGALTSHQRECPRLTPRYNYATPIKKIYADFGLVRDAGPHGDRRRRETPGPVQHALSRVDINSSSSSTSITLIHRCSSLGESRAGEPREKHTLRIN
jgi:hypothetical protein